jgi:aminoglycoside phosphotransferase
VSSAARRKDDPAQAPVSAASETLHDLHGNSGARVVLHAGSGASFVRKTAARPTANARLLAQAAKQNDLGRSGVKLPRVLTSGHDSEGLAFFDMEYVPGRTIANAAASAAPFDRLLLYAGVERLLWLFVTCRGDALPASRFQDKIHEATRAAIARDTCAHVAPQIRVCAKRLHARDWNGIPESPSHGDLTLENIMITHRHEIVFIDCDAAWVSSFWLDLGKLFQDVSGHWCIRQLYAAGVPSVQRAGAIQKLERLAADFRRLAYTADPALPARLPQLAALSLFRALPYARTPSAAEFICARIDAVLDGPP